MSNLMKKWVDSRKLVTLYGFKDPSYVYLSTGEKSQKIVDLEGYITHYDACGIDFKRNDYFEKTMFIPWTSFSYISD